MTIAELRDALKNAPDDSDAVVKSPTGENCPISAIHIGTGGDAAGMVTLECGSGADEMPDDDMSNMDDVDSMAMAAGVDIGKGKPKTPAKKAAPPMDDEAE